MFRNKKDGEEYGYTGDNYNDVVSLLQPYLKKDEKILYASGDGTISESIVEKYYRWEETKTGDMVSAAFMALLIGGVILCILGCPMIGMLMIVLWLSIPLVLVIVLFITYRSKPQSVNCAITDKRVISMIGSHWDEIALKDVSDINVRNRNMIMVRTRVHSAENTAQYIVIYKVKDPFGVKQLLDEAVQRAKINEYQD